MPPHARWPWRRKEGGKEVGGKEGGRNGKTVLKFPLAATAAAAAAAVRVVGLLVCRLHREAATTGTTNRASDRGKEA